MSTDTAAAAAPAPKKSRKGLIVVLAVVILLLAGGGGGAYWFLFRGAADAEAAAAEPAVEEPAPTGIIPLEPFVVNLADTVGSRFLRVTLSLVVADEEKAKAFEADKVLHMKTRSTILELLAQKDSTALVTPEGKAHLKQEIAKAVGHAGGEHELKVADVLFSEFIVQF